MVTMRLTRVAERIRELSPAAKRGASVVCDLAESELADLAGQDPRVQAFLSVVRAACDQTKSGRRRRR